MEDRCYVVYGTGFNPLKIKGYAQKGALLKHIRKQGFRPKASLLSSGRRCTRKATLYNRIKGAKTIRWPV